MNDMPHAIRPIKPKREAVDGVCVDCGHDTPAEEVARVLRITSDGRGRVVCNDCSARIHAAKEPTPIPLQRSMRRPPVSEPDPS